MKGHELKYRKRRRAEDRPGAAPAPQRLTQIDVKTQWSSVLVGLMGRQGPVSLFVPQDWKGKTHAQLGARWGGLRHILNTTLGIVGVVTNPATAMAELPRLAIAPLGLTTNHVLDRYGANPRYDATNRERSALEKAMRPQQYPMETGFFFGMMTSFLLTASGAMRNLATGGIAGVSDLLAGASIFTGCAAVTFLKEAGSGDFDPKTGERKKVLLDRLTEARDGLLNRIEVASSSSSIGAVRRNVPAFCQRLRDSGPIGTFHLYGAFTVLPTWLMWTGVAERAVTDGPLAPTTWMQGALASAYTLSNWHWSRSKKAVAEKPPDGPADDASAPAPQAGAEAGSGRPPRAMPKTPRPAEPPPPAAAPIPAPG